MAKLSEAQTRFLSSVMSNGLLKFRRADMRSHGALLKRGLIAITYSDGNRGEGGYVLTPAGRRSLGKEG